MKYIIMIAILSIMMMEMVALSYGINGILLTLSVGTIAGLAGWVAPQPRIFQR